VLHVKAGAVSSLSIFHIPEPLDRLIADALAKDMNQRPADAEAFATALGLIQRQLPWNRERARLWWMSVHPTDGSQNEATAASPGTH